MTNNSMDGDKTVKRPFNDWPNDAGFNASIEHREPVELAVKGHLPLSLAGTLYRTGPGHYQLEDTASGPFKLSHWFDGFTHVHRFQLVPGPNDSCAVFYTSRRQVDPLLDHIHKTGKLDMITFGQKKDPCESIFHKLKCVFESSNLNPDLVNVGVTISASPAGSPTAMRATEKASNGQPRKVLVIRTDANFIKEIDLESLEPMGVTQQKTLHPDLKGPLSGAHSQYDPENGDVYNYNLNLGRTCTYRIFRSSLKTGKTEVIATISDSKIPPAYIHSFFLTKDFVILAVWGSHLAGGGVKILWDRNMVDAIKPVDARQPVKWLVVDRRHGKGLVATFESPAMFSFHTVNSWQQANSEDNSSVDIYCDIIQYSNSDILHRFYYDNLLSTGPGVSNYAGEDKNQRTAASLTRYRLKDVLHSASTLHKPKSARSAEMVLQANGPLVGDLPTINPSYFMKKSRYVYSVVDRGYSSWVDSISKLDTETKESTYWMHPRHTPGEPIFVQDPHREGEDAGYILSVILDGDKGTSYLLCLDAKTMTEVGRAECDVAVGMGFHGSFVA
ncbi:carotenoid cleavage dioxygenase [Xylogone sp. PMI_703]|nr:carotenoid cleavage dioxygenase [Xylogone sp. PMI_703]